MKGIIRKGSNAEKRLRNISEDISKKIETGKLNGLTQSDVFSACLISKILGAKGVSQTIFKSVSDYFKSFGFMVTRHFNNVNYFIVA